MRLRGRASTGDSPPGSRSRPDAPTSVRLAWRLALGLLLLSVLRVLARRLGRRAAARGKRW